MSDESGKPKRRATTPRNTAMNLLARREHSVAELRQKLADRDHSPEAIDSALEGLLADGLVSDERYAESFINSRIRKGQGPVRISMELHRRGVADDIVRSSMDSARSQWHALAKDVRVRKFGAMMPADYKEKARQMRFLEYRGFTGEQIRAAMGDDFE